MTALRHVQCQSIPRIPTRFYDVIHSVPFCSLRGGTDNHPKQGWCCTNMEAGVNDGKIGVPFLVSGPHQHNRFVAGQAVDQRGVLPLWLGGCCMLASAVSFALYGQDKRAAQRKQWRIPERTLQLLAFAGGWPGALLGQALFRHKHRKALVRLRRSCRRTRESDVPSLRIWGRPRTGS